MSRPRFIAGAVCPHCGCMDRLQILSERGGPVRQCVACGHRDSLPVAGAPAPKSRLDPAASQRGAEYTPTEMIRVLDPDRKGHEPT